MEYMILFLIFVLGTVFGSFGSVLITRIHEGINFSTIKSVLFGRSFCPSCGNYLGFFDLIPIFSWMFSLGNCRHCGNKIGYFYILLEIFSGIIFLFSFYLTTVYLGVDFFEYNFVNYDFFIHFGFLVVVNWMFLIMIFYDILYFQLNTLFWSFLFLWILFFQFFGLVLDFENSFRGGVIFVVVFYLIYFFGKVYVRYRFNEKQGEGFGEGDVMVAFLVGLLSDVILTINGFSMNDMYYVVLSYVLLSSILGVIFAFFNMIFYKGKVGKSIPFLPAMIIAFWILTLYGKDIVDLLVY